MNSSGKFRNRSLTRLRATHPPTGSLGSIFGAVWVLGILFETRDFETGDLGSKSPVSEPKSPVSEI